MKNGKGQMIVFLLIFSIIAIIGYSIIATKKDVTTNKIYSETTDSVSMSTSQKEINVNDSLSKSIFNSIPNMYEEQEEPFSEEFKLIAVMNKIIEDAGELEQTDFSDENVNKSVKKIFGSHEQLDGRQLTQDKIKNGIYYYSTELESYDVLPVGLEGIYTEQILKKVTETQNNYYIYTYCLIGEYVYSDDGSYVNIVIGDKDGNDLVLKFVGEIDSKKWINEYKENLPIFKYSLKKTSNSYYLTSVEQIN